MKLQPIVTGDSPVWFQKAWQVLSVIINGRLSFGDGTTPCNLDGVWVTAITNTVEFTVTHNLGRVPVGFLAVKKSAAVDLYAGVTTWTKNDIHLVGTAVGVSVLLFVF